MKNDKPTGTKNATAQLADPTGMGEIPIDESQITHLTGNLWVYAGALYLTP